MNDRAETARAYAQYPLTSLALATMLTYSLVREKSRNGEAVVDERAKAELLFALGRYIHGDALWQAALREHGYTQAGRGESYENV